MAINRINETDLQGKLVSQLSNRPTDPRSAGGDNMTAQQVKARHDALGLLVKDKLNELLDALNNATVNGEPVTPLSDLITVVADSVSKSLTEWIEAKLTKDVTAGEGVHAYGVDDDGEQTMLPVSDAATEGAIPQYGTGGVLPVADGTEDGHAVAKGQMTAAITSAVNALSATLVASINAKYTKPGTGIPLADLAQDVRDEIEGAVKASAAENYSALVGILSESPKTKYKAGQRFLIGTYGVPDVGVLLVEDTAVSYTYTTDAAFEASLMAGTLQIGYFVLRPVEGKTNLEDYSTTAETNEAISDSIDLLVDALVDGVMAVAEATYAESATYAQQADLANQINTDREIEDADTACPPVVFGTVGGNAEVQSGLNKFTELRGHTIKWNQHARELTSTYWYVAGATGTISDGVATFTASAQYGALRMESAYRHIPVVTGHKFLLFADVKLTTATDKIKLALNWNEGAGEASISVSSSTSWQRVAGIVTNSGQSYNDGFVQVFDARTADLDAVQVKNICCFDLTDIYGAGKEPSAVSEFLASFPLPYYPYNAGALLSSKSSSVDFVKRNQWDEQTESGTLDENGAPSDSATTIRSKNFCECFENTVYFATKNNHDTRLYWYDANKTFISRNAWGTNDQTYTAPANARFFKMVIFGTTYNHDICIYINWDTPGLPYVPYSKQRITLPNIVLRRVGDVYDVAYQTGGGKRRIGERAYQSGDENDPDVSTDGTTTLYVLETETDITLEENPGWDEYAEIDNFGTVKFNQDPAQDIPVPQAYFVRYTVNLVEFLDSLFVHCGGDVSKLALVE